MSDTETEGREGLKINNQKLSKSAATTTTANGVGGVGGGQDGLLPPKNKPGQPKVNGKMDFEWQAQNFPVVSSIPPKKKQKANDKIWDIVREIPAAEEQIPCRKCFKDTVVSWASNLNPEDNWDLCEGCKVVEF